MKPDRPSNELVRLARAFGYSMKGLKAACAQPAFRVELAACVVMAPAAWFVTLDGVERALLIGSLLLVLIVELLNSGIEAAIDRISTDYHELSGRAKDLGSAAVLVSLINAAVIWLAIVTV